MLIAFCGSVASYADSLGDRFSGEYEAAAKRLEDFYSRVELVEEQQTPERVQAGLKAVSVSFYSNAAQLRLDVNKPELVKFSIVESPAVSFRVHKEAVHASYQLTELHRRHSLEYRESMRFSGTLPFAPYCLIEQRIIDFLKAPKLEIVRVELANSETDEQTRVSWRLPYQDEDGTARTQVGCVGPR